MKYEKSDKNQRGGCLTVFIIVFIITNVLGAFASIGMRNSPLLKAANEPSWLAGISILFNVLQIAGLVLVYNWKKVGAYLYSVVLIVSFILSSVTSKVDVPTFIGTIVGDLLMLGIFYFLIRPVWKFLK